MAAKHWSLHTLRPIRLHALIGLVALLHVGFLVLEMFLWDKPKGLRTYPFGWCAATRHVIQVQVVSTKVRQPQGWTNKKGRDAMVRHHFLRRGFLLTLVLSFLLTLPAAAQTTITFDDVPPGTDINTHYQPQGVTFSCSWGVDCTGANVTVMIPGSGSNTVPSSPPNIVTQSYDINFDGCFDDETAIVRATFADPVDFASIMALNQGVEDHAYLGAYSADGTELDFDGQADFTGGSVLLTVQAQGIAYVEFSGWQEDSACFDDLTFGRQPVPSLPQKVVIGLAILLALAGLLLLARTRAVRD